MNGSNQAAKQRPLGSKGEAEVDPWPQTAGVRPLLAVDGLTKCFVASDGMSHRAVDSVSFDLKPGGSLAVVGESGSGKTTTARIVAGLERATSGTVTLDGRDITRREAHMHRRSRRAAAAVRDVQMVFQDPFASLDPRQRVGAGLRELIRRNFTLSREAAQHRVEMLLDEVGLDLRHADQLPRALSGGQRQRVAIARALALEPRVLILDEAVSALDVSVQAQVLNLLADIRAASDIAYLFVSHDLGVVRQVTDTCLVLNQGRVVECGSTSEVLDDPQELYTKMLLAAVPKVGWKPSRRQRL